jgi:RNA polymerase sigma-70 factor (ECF subfamily)
MTERRREPAEQALEFDQIVAQHRRPLRHHILGIVRNGADADDLLQETFVRALRGLDALEAPAKLSSWLHRIAANASRDWLRSTTADPVRSSRDGFEDDAADGDARRAGLVERNEMRSCVAGHLRELPEHYRSAIVLHDVEGMTVAEMAEQLGATPGALKIRLHRARARLRKALQEKCAFSHDEDGVFVCERK